MQTRSFLLTIILRALFTDTAISYNRNQISVDSRHIPDSLESTFRHRISLAERAIASRLQTEPSNFNLEAKIFATITLDGRLLTAEVEETSGSDEFDKAALRAVYLTPNFGQFPHLGPKLLLAEIRVSQNSIQTGSVHRNNIQGQDPSRDTFKTQKSDWIEDTDLGNINYDSRPWEYTNHSPKVGSEEESASSDTTNGTSSGLSLSLQGFRPLSQYQLKYIPTEQKDSYLEKLSCWSKLSLKEKFQLW